MNSSKKIRQYVQKFVKIDDWQFWVYIGQFKCLKKYINGVEENKKSSAGICYRYHFLASIGIDKDTDSEYICNLFVNAFQNELELNKHNVFETFKIIYALKILDGPNSSYTCYAYKKNEANIRFVEELLKKADFKNDGSLYKVASMVNSIVLK